MPIFNQKYKSKIPIFAHECRGENSFKLKTRTLN